MAENKIAYHVLIEGRVTGVGFRWSAVNYARNFSTLRGYIRNLSYNQVEAVIQGSASEVELMLQYLRQGPSFARVDNVKANRRPLSEELNIFSAS